jgi:hypothetical protein
MLMIIGKSLVDVSKLPALKHMGWPDRKRTPFSPHQLIPFCPHVGYHPNAVIVLNHYVGSWEACTHRANDSRKGNFKNRKEWEKSAYRKKGERGDDIRPWIKGFVRLFGEQKAKLLFANTGLPADYTVSDKADASWQASNASTTSDADQSSKANASWQASNASTTSDADQRRNDKKTAQTGLKKLRTRLYFKKSIEEEKEDLGM